MTLRNTEAFGVSDTHGSIEDGKFADLLLLGQNPLENLSAYDTIDMVILNGKQIARDSLSATQQGR